MVGRLSVQTGEFTLENLNAEGTSSLETHIMQVGTLRRVTVNADEYIQFGNS